MKIMKKLIAIIIVSMMAIGFNVVPAEAYTELKTSVAITATGIVGPNTETITIDLVTQGGGVPSPAGQITFETASGPTADSEEAIRIRTGSNVLTSRIVVYTDNDNNTTGDNNVPTLDPEKGIDGGGMVGQTDPDYAVSLMWAVETIPDTVPDPDVAGPNRNVNYGFDGDTDDGVGEIYMVDKRHRVSFCKPGDKNTAIDNNPLYEDLAGTIPTDPLNVVNDGLYPQSWDKDYWDPTLTDDPATSDVDERLVSPSLYSTIATVAFGLGHDGTNYICSVPDISTAATDDNILANLGIGGTDGIYIYVGANFVGKPAQTYSTGQLYVAVAVD